MVFRSLARPLTPLKSPLYQRLPGGAWALAVVFRASAAVNASASSAALGERAIILPRMSRHLGKGKQKNLVIWRGHAALYLAAGASICRAQPARPCSVIGRSVGVQT